MKTFVLEVFVSLENAKDYDVVRLDAAAKAGQPEGHLKVSLGMGRRGDKSGYWLSGDCLAVEPGDDVAAVNVQLASDLGEIGAVREDDPLAKHYRKGQAIDLWYVLNHDGLPLAYNAAIRATFAKEGKGRQSMDFYGKAVAWAMETDPSLMSSLPQGTPEGRAALIAKYRASL